MNVEFCACKVAVIATTSVLITGLPLNDKVVTLWIVLHRVLSRGQPSLDLLNRTKWLSLMAVGKPNDLTSIVVLYHCNFCRISSAALVKNLSETY